ncbi:MAG: class I SAM-dependent methyltransferase [Candidatus Omnitrophica bacterium]|nr:class I SAM-dependent methyltransferase [Candidatus Omnitrophota bacterium]
MKPSKVYSKIRNKLFRKFIILHYYLYRDELRTKINHVFQYDDLDIGLFFEEQEEGALPGDKKYSAADYYKYMVSRYIFSIRYIKNKTVLDSGCGFGWGSYLVCNYPEKIISIDLNEKALDFAKSHWDDKKLHFLKCSLLNIDSLNETFDVILGMEIIEHLSSKDGETYLYQCFRNLTDGGILILSSFFPDLRKESEKAEKRNKFHLKIFTKQEIKKLAQHVGFSKIQFLGNLLVILKKRP